MWVRLSVSVELSVGYTVGDIGLHVHTVGERRDEGTIYVVRLYRWYIQNQYRM